ncbi:MAG: hemerythrin family protein [Firmicutes bacterium]|nr:hemerythrin family protein [Dethiobacter sp.]MBS3889229.1 hemerythrin family protein [Bacillota bacterium]MBS4053883.1 hemerythrin family protein [Thermaerobacter sp.]
MALKWSSDLSVGVAEVDNQHQEIIERLNILIDACNKGKGKAEVGSLINFLDGYTVEHFKMEEELQRKYAYPDYTAHKSEHDNFLRTLNALKVQFSESGATLPLTIQINRTVVAWLIDHVTKTDKAMGAYLRTKL